jgi:hypothetical protein
MGAANPRFHTETGTREGELIVLRNAARGAGLYGCYVTLPPGAHRAVVHLADTPVPSGPGAVDVCLEQGKSVARAVAFNGEQLAGPGPTIHVNFELFKATEDVEVRVISHGGLTLAIRGVEIIHVDYVERPRPPRPAGRRPLDILYISYHEILEFDELRMLTSRGHHVFSIGAFSDPNGAVRYRPRPPQFFRAGDWEHYQHEGMSPDFLRQFDVAIVMGDVQVATLVAALEPNLPVVYRSIGQTTIDKEAALQPYGSRIKVVRYSERERFLPGHLPADAVIYNGKYLGDFFQGWSGGERILTFHNSYRIRDRYSTLSLADYCALAEALPCDLYGSHNDDIAASRGIASPAEQMDLFRHAGLYLSIYTVAPPYLLSFVEAMAMGLPIVAPSNEFVARNTHPEVLRATEFSPERNESPELLGDDPRLLFSSLEDAHEKIKWLMRNESYRQEVSHRLRATFAERFDAEKIADQWDSFLYSVA